MLRKKKGNSFVAGYVNDKGEFFDTSLKSKIKSDGSTQLLDGFDQSYGTLDVIVPRYNPEKLASMLEENTYHSKAIQAKAEDGSGIGWEILMTEEGKEKNKESVENVLSEIDLNEVYFNALIDFETIGYRAIEVARNGRLSSNAIDALYHVNAKDVRVHRKRNKYVQQKGGKYVWFKRVGYEKDVHINTGKEYKEGTLPLRERANELWFDAKYTPMSPIYGMPDGLPALGAIVGDIKRRDYNLNFFQSGGMAKWAVVISGDIQSLEKEDVLDDSGNILEYGYSIHEEIYSQIEALKDNPQGVIVSTIPVVDGGKVDVTFEKLSDEQKEISFRDFRDDNRNEVLSAHGVPRQRLGISEEGSMGGHNSEELDGIYVSGVVKPLTAKLEEFMNNVWIPSLGVTGVKFRVKNRDEKGVEADIDILEKLSKMGAVTGDEVRDLFKDRFNLSDKQEKVVS